MSDEPKDHDKVANDAQSRVVEIDGLFRSIRGTVRDLTNDASRGEPGAPKQALAKLSELQSTHERLLRAEESFHEKYGDYLRPGEFDLDAIRDQIGRRLDNLRAAKRSE